MLRFTHLSYRVGPVRLPGGPTITGQIISLDPRAVSTLRWSRRTGAVRADVHWMVGAPNALYNGRHTITFSDHGKRTLSAFRRLGRGRFGFRIISVWHGTVNLRRWSVARRTLPPGRLAITGTWTGFYVVTLKGA